MEKNKIILEFTEEESLEVWAALFLIRRSYNVAIKAGADVKEVVEIIDSALIKVEEATKDLIRK